MLAGILANRLEDWAAQVVLQVHVHCAYAFAGYHASLIAWLTRG